MVPLAHDLATRLPLTRQALAEGIIGDYKAQVIAEATRVLDDAAAAEAEAAVVPDGVTGKTPAQIRAAIGRAVVKADPDAARRRRAEAEKDPRVELWREDAGTAAICGYGLPPDAALAAGQAITTAALDLKAAGLPGTMDQLRARAYLDALLGQDSRPTAPQPASPETARTEAPGAEAAGSSMGSPAPGTGSGQHDPAAADADPDREARQEHGNHPAGPTGPADHRTPGSGNGRTAEDDRAPGNGPAAQDRPGGAAGPAARPTGPAGRAGTGPPPAAAINLTIPLTTLLGLTGHPGQAAAFGPIDAALARTMATHAAGNPATTWCLTITDEHGHPTAHGCAHPARRGKPRRTNDPSGPPPGGHTSPPGGNDPPIGGNHHPSQHETQPTRYRQRPTRYRQRQRSARSRRRQRPARSRRRPARREPDLAAAPPRPHPRPDRRPGTPGRHRMRPPAPDHRPRPRPHPPPPDPDQGRRMHLPALPPRRPPLRLRAHRALGTRRPHLQLQHRAPLPPPPPPQAGRRMDTRTKPARPPHMDHTRRTPLHHRPHHLPHLTKSRPT